MRIKLLFSIIVFSIMSFPALGESPLIGTWKLRELTQNSIQFSLFLKVEQDQVTVIAECTHPGEKKIVARYTSSAEVTNSSIRVLEVGEKSVVTRGSSDCRASVDEEFELNVRLYNNGNSWIEVNLGAGSEAHRVL